MSVPDLHFISARDLVPDAWAGFHAAGPVRVFNPGLLADGEGWILAYRVVGPDQVRRIGICRLDRAFRVKPGSTLAWSEAVRFPAAGGFSERATGWFADPRLYRMEGRMFLHWNSGWHEPENHQFLQEVDAVSLLPLGVARELRLRGPRRALEKNWSFFGDGPHYALYSLMPQRVLRFSLEGTGAIEFEDFAAMGWEDGGYRRRFGELRGGTPPQRVGADYFGIGHSVHGTPDHYRYVAAAYRFAAEPPFRFTGGPAGPLALAAPMGAERAHPPLNPAIAEVIYPCGAAFDGTRWIVSFGVNDERCALGILTHGQILAALTPVCPGPAAGR
jgi:predicted GH43/DUF377 family glycosyl hydrolase